MIAAECCGSCDNKKGAFCKVYNYENVISEHNCNTLDKPDKYIPRNPIENPLEIVIDALRLDLAKQIQTVERFYPYKKMWEELKRIAIKTHDKFYNEFTENFLKFINQLEKENE